MKYGMVVDIDRCTGCGACMVACAVENNVPPPQPGANERTGLTPLRVYRVDRDGRSAFIPISCQHCDHETPCVAVCPQNAVELDRRTGIVGEMPERCLGCRYCMTACPYHARYFNWWDPAWPNGMERTLNPSVAPRMRGVVEKCNFCHGRWHAAKAKLAAEGSREPAAYTTACMEACPAGAIAFGDVAKLNLEGTFRLLESLHTETKVYYRTAKAWVREAIEGRVKWTRNSSREA